MLPGFVFLGRRLVLLVMQIVPSKCSFLRSSGNVRDPPQRVQLVVPGSAACRSPPEKSPLMSVCREGLSVEALIFIFLVLELRVEEEQEEEEGAASIQDGVEAEDEELYSAATIRGKKSMYKMQSAVKPINASKFKPSGLPDPEGMPGLGPSGGEKPRLPRRGPPSGCRLGTPGHAPARGP